MGWIRPVKSHGEEVIGWREFRKLFGISVREQSAHLSGLARYPVLRLVDRSGAGPAPSLPAPPDSPWVEAVREVARLQLDEPRWLLHSERTWLFATALIEFDCKKSGEPRHSDLAPELVYIASLLHDTGLLMENRSRCFAVTGAEFAASTACEVGADPARAKVVAKAISSHISVRPGNVLGHYLQAGSLLDVSGTRVWDLERAMVEEVCRLWSREGFPEEARYRWAAECALFPNGRAAFARRPGCLSLATYVAPLPH